MNGGATGGGKAVQDGGDGDQCACEDEVVDEESAKVDWSGEGSELAQGLRLRGLGGDGAAEDGVGLAVRQPRHELFGKRAAQRDFEPAEIEGDESGQDNGEPEDGIFAEEGCGVAPEGSHWGGWGLWEG